MQTVSDPIALDLKEIQYRLETLTERQKQILSLLVRGNNLKVIGALLSSKPEKIRYQISQAIEKTAANNQGILVYWYSVFLFAKRHHGNCAVPRLEGRT